MATWNLESAIPRGRAASIALVLGLCVGGCSGDDGPSGSSGDAGAASGGEGGASDGGTGATRPDPTSIGRGGSPTSGGSPSTGAAPSLGGSSGVVPTGPLDSVSVRVVGLRGAPVGQVQVSLGGQVDVTDAAGVAEFRHVATPYAAMVGADGHAYVYSGLRTESPVLHVGADPDTSHGSLSGALSGLAAYTTTPGARLQQEVVFAADADRATASATSPDFTVQSRWRASSAGVVRAIQYEYDSAGPLGGYPLNFLVYGTASTDAEGQDVSVLLAPILQREVAGTISMPAAAIPERVCLQLLFDDGANLEFERFSGERDAWSYRVPTLTGAAARFAWYVTYPNYAQVRVIEPVADGAEPAVDVPLPLDLQTPEDGATEVGPGTAITFGDPGSGIHMVQLFSESSFTAPRITLYLDGETAVLPDLSEVGLVLPSEVDYRWTAWSLRGVSSVNELVQTADYAGDIGCGNPRPTRLRAAVTGPWRTLTTEAR